ncbi:MAG: hypothetical protein OXG35_25280 [Acidobacteria bacterium]|nr:hypothetical protein [Acidobacteriota bacterium]
MRTLVEQTADSVRDWFVRLAAEVEFVARSGPGAPAPMRPPSRVERGDERAQPPPRLGGPGDVGIGMTSEAVALADRYIEAGRYGEPD